MSRNIFLVVLGSGAAALGAAALLYFLNPAQPAGLTLVPTQTISVGSTNVHVALADTPQKREQGLSGIESLKSDEGMLFVFPQDGTYSFWMKDMLFSIDILWISEGGRVVYIVPSVSPDTFPRGFTPNTPARYVLEVPAGFAAQHEIGVGSKLEFSPSTF